MFENARKRHIGLIEQLKFPAGLGIAGVQVRMQLKGASAVSPFYGGKVSIFLKLENCVAFLEGYLAGTASQGLFKDKGVGFATAVAGKQTVLAQVLAALLCKVCVGSTRDDARAEFFGHGKACGVFNITAKKGPGAADGGFAFVYAASFPLLEENAVRVCTATDFKFAAHMVAVFFYNGFGGKPHVCGQARKVSGADHDSAASFATMAAHVAIKNRIR